MGRNTIEGEWRRLESVEVERLIAERVAARPPRLVRDDLWTKRMRALQKKTTVPPAPPRSITLRASVVASSVLVLLALAQWLF